MASNWSIGADSSLEPDAVRGVTMTIAPDELLMRRLIVITALTLFGLACSRTELAYRNADWLLEQYARKTVKASAAQRDHWQPQLQTTLRHHREQELPLVIAYLDLATHISSETDSSPGAACLVDGALLLYQRHARLAVDLAAPLLAQLDADQIRNLTEYTRQQQKDALERYLDPNPLHRKLKRQQRITERIEKWTGELNDSQRQQIRDAVERIPDLSASWLAYRAQQTNTLLTMLETGANEASLREYLDNWWVRRAGTSTRTRQLWHLARHEFVQLMDSLATTLTNRQRTTLQNRLGSLRRDLALFASHTPQSVNLQLVPACASGPA